MGIIKSITVRNFRGIRQEISIPLTQATYLVGPNNSGKTTILSALHCFVESSAFSPDYLNKTERAGKKEGSLRSDIALTFDLALVTGKERKKRMTDLYGSDLTIRKSFTWREISRTTQVNFLLQGKASSFDELPSDVQALIHSLTVSYIHPQEGAELLRKAQDKFKQRLFANWGRHQSVAEKLKTVQSDWDELRKTASSYLSAALTERLRSIWPDSTTKVDLPERIEQIVAISDIAFRSSPSLPEVTLPHQGTGAQAAILYQTHYILDSDRSLHRGMYFPIWLLEEPESFLHGDIALQLANLIASDDWLANIQMVISTHSPIILSASRRNAASASWVAFEQHSVVLQKGVDEIDDDSIKRIGSMMGDANFDVYFDVAQRGEIIFLEDSRPLTADRLRAASIKVTNHLNGISEVKKYLLVLEPLSSFLRDPIRFIVDSDSGLDELGAILARCKDTKESQGWRRYTLGQKLHVITLPKGQASEDLFDQWTDLLNGAVDEIYDAQLRFRQQVPVDLTRAVGELRRIQPTTRDQALGIVRRHQDTKDRFWKKVQKHGYLPSPSRLAGLIDLLK